MSLSLVQPAPEIPNFPKYVHRTEVSLSIEKKDLTFAEWKAAFDLLKKNEKSHQWQIGDHLVDGEKRFGEDYCQEIDPDEEEEREEEGNGETYRSYQWVAEKIPAVHRCTNVPWTLHRDVAGMEPDERNYWLQRVSTVRAAGEKFSRRRLQKEIKAAKNKLAEPEIITTEMKALHERVVQEELDGKLIEVGHWKETPSDPLLSTVYGRIEDILKWQRDRTPESDCAAILKSLSGDEGAEAPLRISDRDLAAWLHDRGFLMRKPELGTGGCPSRCTIEHEHVEKSGNLGLMVRLKMLTVQTREDSRGDEQRGGITFVYALEIDFAEFLGDIDGLQTKPERVAAMRKDWIKRLERYSPELLPKKEEKADASKAA